MIPSIRDSVLVLMLAAALVQCASTQSRRVPHDQAALWPDHVPEGRIDFAQHVRPLLEDQCLECHNQRTAHEYAGLNLETRKLALTTGRDAPVIVPGNAAASLLIRVLKLDSNHPISMPAAPEKVEGVRLAILEKWINEGAEWPEEIRLAAP